MILALGARGRGFDSLNGPNYNKIELKKYLYNNINMIPLYYDTMNSSKKKELTNNEIYALCFDDLHNKHGYGRKRIAIGIPNSITEKVPFSGFGFKDDKGVLFVGVRMWLDQGNYVKFQQYDKNYNMHSHFITLIKKFHYEYDTKLNNFKSS